MKQFAFGTIYGLAGLIFLFVAFTTINETAVENKKPAGELEISKSFGFSSETANLPETAVSPDDVRTMVQKVRFAQGVLEEFWSNEFARSGYRFRSPGVKIFENVTYSACGESRDARYCRLDHTIYLNAYFLYNQMQRVSQRLGTDGDMAAVVVIAHEYGHSVQAQVPGFSRLVELNADCMAGAFTRFSAQKGYLDSDDIAEASSGLAMNPEYSVWFNPTSHGTSAERVTAFGNGYNGGVAACR
jgi:predicted metalloprotease